MFLSDEHIAYVKCNNVITQLREILSTGAKQNARDSSVKDSRDLIDRWLRTDFF